jgi:hypothetical protein
MAARVPVIARHPVVAFMVIGLGAYFLTVAIPPIVNAQVLPLHGVWGGVLGVGIGAFVVTGALAGATVLVILLGAVCGGGSRSAGIWSRYSPFRSERR